MVQHPTMWWPTTTTALQCKFHIDGGCQRDGHRAATRGVAVHNARAHDLVACSATLQMGFFLDDYFTLHPVVKVSAFTQKRECVYARERTQKDGVYLHERENTKKQCVSARERKHKERACICMRERTQRNSVYLRKKENAKR